MFKITPSRTPCGVSLLRKKQLSLRDFPNIAWLDCIWGHNILSSPRYIPPPGTGPTDTLISCLLHAPKSASKSPDTVNKGIGRKRQRIKSLGQGSAKFPDLDSAVTLSDRRWDRDVPKVRTQFFEKENLHFPALVEKKKKRICLTICRRCCKCESYSEYRKYSACSSVGGWESGTDVARDDGSTSPACQGEASTNNTTHPKWAPHFLFSLI